MKLNASLFIHPLTFITEALCLSGSPSYLVLHHLGLLLQAFTTCCINKAMPINGKCHIKQLRAGKSCKTCLTNHTWSISHHITPVVINTLSGGHRDTHIPTCKPRKPGVRRPTHALFKINFCVSYNYIL